eukprot:gene14404-7670_t
MDTTDVLKKFAFQYISTGAKRARVRSHRNGAVLVVLRYLVLQGDWWEARASFIRTRTAWPPAMACPLRRNCIDCVAQCRRVFVRCLAVVHYD